MSRVLVLGAGPAGLYTALLLARRGITVTVLEKEAAPGGLAAGLVVAGQRVDRGSHRLHPSLEPAIMADLARLLGDELQTRRRKGRIRIDGRWLAFPFSPADLIRGLPPRLAVRLAAGAAAASLRRRDTRSFSGAVATGLGRPMGEAFYFPYARKIWGVEPELIAGEQARRRISADTPARLLAKAWRGSKAGASFLYPSGGFGRIPEALAEAAVGAGAELRLANAVTGVAARSGGWLVETTAGTFTGKVLLSTLPVTVLARLLGPPPDVARACDGLRFRSMALTYLVTPYPRWTGFDAHYLPGPEVEFTRVSEPKNYRSSTSDPADRSVICVETPCDFGDEVWTAPDQTLVAAARDGLIRLGLPDPGGRGEVHRIRHAYPVYLHGSEAALAAVEGWLSGFEGLITLGRQGLFAHDNTHHALAMAAAASAAVGDDLGLDQIAWEGRRAGFRRHVVED